MRHHAIRFHFVYVSVACCAIAACSSTPPVVPGPLGASAMLPPLNIEHINNGSIFQAGMTTDSLFTDARKPRRVGDTLKVNISETLNATNTVTTTTSRDTKLSQQGPGGQGGMGLLSDIMKLTGSAAGSSSLKGDGTTLNSGTFTAQVAATVINVLPNGNLVVAGDRVISLNGNANVLRFSAIVNPHDIQSGNVVASADTVNARYEVVGHGDVSDASTKTWMQRVLADSLSFW